MRGATETEWREVFDVFRSIFSTPPTTRVGRHGRNSRDIRLALKLALIDAARSRVTPPCERQTLIATRQSNG